MARPKSDAIDRSIETLFARGRMDALPKGKTHALPQLSLHDSPTSNSATATLPRPAQENSPGSNLISTSEGDVWLSGNVVMCSCPECNSPVSIRLWLMVADCWNCESAIELSYEQRMAAEKLARQTGPAAEAPVPRPRPTMVNIPEPAQSGASEVEPAQSINAEENAEDMRRLVNILRKMTNNLPAWLISTLVHLVMLLILALILLPQTNDAPSITLSTAVGPMDQVGGIHVEAPPEAELEFDSITPPDYDYLQRKLRDVRIAADQDARELLLDPEPVAELPDLNEVRELTLRPKSQYTFAMRDPRLRNEIVTREGGTTLSEAAVSRGLRWLASVQNKNGSWSLADYKRDLDRNRGDAAATSLALLPFLGAGQTHEYGKYKETVAAGLKWLMEHQKPNGELMYGIHTNAAIYAHGQASIVLIEALAMTGDEQFREPAQKAIDYIEAFQHKHGGWRYKRGEPGDTSVLGWQLMALQSARGSNTGLRVEDATLKLAEQYLDQAGRPYQRGDYKTAPDGTLYRYRPRDREPNHVMTAEGILCRMYLGWKRDDARMLYAVDWLIDNALPKIRARRHDIYYYYYATQVMHHFGGKHWETWNRHLRDLLVAKQETKGRYAGSWDSENDRHGQSGGRIYVTALSICTLEVYYRHLPLFKQLDLN